MDNDIEWFLRGVVEIALWSLWLAIVGITIYLMVLWLSMFGEVRSKKVKFIVAFFPVYLVDSSLLSSKGRVMRKRFLRVFLFFMLVVAVYCALLISGLEGLDQSMF